MRPEKPNHADPSGKSLSENRPSPPAEGSFASSKGVKPTLTPGRPYRHRRHAEPIWRLAEEMGVEVHLPTGLNMSAKEERWAVAIALAKVAKPELETDREDAARLLWEERKNRTRAAGKQERWAYKILLRMYEPDEVTWPRGLHARARLEARRRDVPWCPRFCQ